MIRAVVQNGVIQPLEPLPPDLRDGREVIVDDLDKHTSDAEELAKWSKEMNELTAALNDPEEWRAIETALTEADQQARKLVQREAVAQGQFKLLRSATGVRAKMP